MERGAGVIRRSPITWFLVADGARAQVYTRERVKIRIPMSGNTGHRHYEEKIEEELTAVEGMQWEAPVPEDYQMGNNLLGRVFESMTTARHMSGPSVDIRDDLKLRFMHTIANQLQAACQRKLFDRLVLIAPAKLLGELKKQLDENVLDRVVAELPKDLTHYEGRKLVTQLEEIV